MRSFGSHHYSSGFGTCWRLYSVSDTTYCSLRGSVRRASALPLSLPPSLVAGDMNAAGAPEARNARSPPIDCNRDLSTTSWRTL